MSRNLVGAVVRASRRIFSYILLGLSLSTLVLSSAAAQQCNSQTGDKLCTRSPGRVELSGMCGDNPATKSVIDFSWTYQSGTPSGASCGYLDTDGNGNADFAVCARTDGSVAELFICNDSASSSCGGAGTAVSPSPASLACSAATISGKVTVSCSISFADLGVSSARLVNVCSHSSNNQSDPNGTCKSCVFENGSVLINKTAVDAGGNTVAAGSAPTFSFSLTSGGNTATGSVLGSDSVLIGVPAIGTYDLAETLPSKWNFTSAICVNGAGTTLGTVSSSGISGISVGAGDAITCDVRNDEAVGASLHLDKVADVSSFNAAGQPVNYTYTVTNTGNIALSLLGVTDDKICAGSSVCITNCGKNVLQINETTTCTGGPYVTTQPDLDAGNVTNSAQAIAQYQAGATIIQVASNTAQAIVPGVQTRDISVLKAGTFNDTNANGLADAGETVDYTVTVTNSGNITTTIDSVTDPLIPVLNCTPVLPATLAPSDASVCSGSHTLTQSDIDAGAITNVATGCTAVPASADLCKTSTVTVTLPTADHLDLQKTGIFADDIIADGLAEAGEHINFTLTVTNQGNQTLDNVTVSDPLLGALSCVPAQGSSLAPNDQMVCSGSYALTQADIDLGSVTNDAVGASTQAGPVPAQAIVPLPLKPDFNINKAGSFRDDNGDGSAQAGEHIDYTITLVNTGNVTLTNVMVSDPVAGTLTCSPTTPVSSVAPGDQVACSGSYAITAADITAGGKANIATGSSTEAGPKTSGVTVALVAPTPAPTATSTPTPQPTAVVLGCTDLSVKDALLTLDGNALAQKTLVVRIAGRVKSLEGATSKNGVKAGKIVAQANALYLAAWTAIWTIPQTITKCTNTALCVASDHSTTIQAYQKNASAFHDLLTQVIKLLPAGQQKSNATKTVIKAGDKLIAQASAAVATIPTTTQSCTMP